MAKHFSLYLYALWSLILKQRKSIPKEIQTIAVLQSMKLGDMVCTTPLFRAIKKNFPNAHLIVLGDALNKEVLAGNTDVDEYIVYKESEISLLQKNLHGRIDIGILPGPNPMGLALFASTGTKMIIAPTVVGGVSPYATHWYKLLSIFIQTVPHRFGHYAPGEYLKLLEPLGIHTNDTTKYIFATEAAHIRAKELLLGKKTPFVAIAPGAGNSIKRWPGERFAAVADYCTEMYQATVIVIGGTKDASDTEEMLQAVRHPEHVVNLSEKLSIDELKAVLAKMDLFISVDTGPIYIAEAAEVPTIDIVGPVGEGEQPPRGPKHLVLVPKRSSAEVHIMNSRIYNQVEAERQANATTVAEVTAAVDMLIAQQSSL
jgi:ADP-heptose:LPS heptosyltransferase